MSEEEVDYDKINSMDFTVYDEVRSFYDMLENFSSPVIHIDYSWVDDDPVVELVATDRYREDAYAFDCQRHPGLNDSEFDIIYDLWVMTFEDEFFDVELYLEESPLGRSVDELGSHLE